jgi:hypothetical protein
MMEAVSTSETSISFYQTTRHNIPEDTYLHTRSRDNLKSHSQNDILSFLSYGTAEIFMQLYSVNMLGSDSPVHNNLDVMHSTSFLHS